MERRSFIKVTLSTLAVPFVATPGKASPITAARSAGPRWLDAADPRFPTLQKGFNARWPATPAAGASAIAVCTSWQDTLVAANQALARGQRITVRSGGHCYEGFVSNANGDDLAILDLSQMNGMDYNDAAGVVSEITPGAGAYRLRVAAGAQNWPCYQAMYKLAGKTLPGGSCYSVGLGGHVTGGGYGTLSRQHGLIVDWLSAVDILVPSADGSHLVARHVGEHSTGIDRDLFIACRGGGGGNFGIVVNFYFRDLPDAPRQAYLLGITYRWSDLQRAGGSQGAFATILRSFAGWFEENDRHWNDPAAGNGGLFAVLKINARASGDVVLGVQFSDIDGRVGHGKDAPFDDFVDTMTQIDGAQARVGHAFAFPELLPHVDPDGVDARAEGIPGSDLARRLDWLALVQTVNGSGSPQRGKYKSDYRRAGFTADEIDVLWKRFHDEGNDPRLSQTLLQIDSYGGAINAFPAASETCVPQRQSLLKSQYMTYWKDAGHDDFHLRWMRDTYDQVYQAGHGRSRPYPGSRYQGCYINYPDIDMLTVDGQPDPAWLELYYGEKAPFLVRLKRVIDPKNIFRHAMSIPLDMPR